MVGCQALYADIRPFGLFGGQPGVKDKKLIRLNSGVLWVKGFGV